MNPQKSLTQNPKDQAIAFEIFVHVQNYVDQMWDHYRPGSDEKLETYVDKIKSFLEKNYPSVSGFKSKITKSAFSFIINIDQSTYEYKATATQFRVSFIEGRFSDEVITRLNN